VVRVNSYIIANNAGSYMKRVISLRDINWKSCVICLIAPIPMTLNLKVSLDISNLAIADFSECNTHNT